MLEFENVDHNLALICITLNYGNRTCGCPPQYSGKGTWEFFKGLGRRWSIWTNIYLRSQNLLPTVHKMTQICKLHVETIIKID